MMRLRLGYPDNRAERELLKGRNRREMLKEIMPIITPEQLVGMQSEVKLVVVADALLDYLQDLLEFSRISPLFNGGLSPRAGLAILHCAKAWALLHGRRHVIPEDVQAVFPSIISHRLLYAEQSLDKTPSSAADLTIKQVPIP